MNPIISDTDPQLLGPIRARQSRPIAADVEGWRERIKAFHESGLWNSVLGPRPTEDGCCAPKEARAWLLDDQGMARTHHSLLGDGRVAVRDHRPGAGRARLPLPDPYWTSDGRPP
jgi:hypothetical protein